MSNSRNRLPVKLLLLPATMLLFLPLGSSVAKRSVSFRSSQLEPLRTAANREFVAGRISHAAGLYQKGLTLARAGKSQSDEAVFLTGLANCSARTLRFSTALGQYLEARHFARQARRNDLLGVIATNLSSLYIHMGDAASARAALSDVPSSQWNQSWLLMQAANVERASRNFEGARQLFARAIERAEEEGNVALQSDGLNILSLLLWQSGHTSAAELHAIEAFRLRAMFAPRRVPSSYYNLGLISTAQGNYPQAALLLTKAIHAARENPMAIAIWAPYYHRGRLRALQHQHAAALADFRLAIDFAQRWRADVVSSDSVRVHSDAGLHQVVDHYLRSGMAVLRQAWNPELAQELYAVAERGRALSLQEQIRSGPRHSPDFYAAVERLRTAEIICLQADTTENRRAADLARLRLIELESKFPNEPQKKDERNLNGSPLKLLQQSLRGQEALISFYLGDTESYAWAATQEGLEVQTLAARRPLEESVHRFRTALVSGTNWKAAGRQLYAQLFGALSPAVHARSDWLLVLDGELFSLPVAALSDVTGRLVVEKHTTRVLPSAELLLQRRSDASRGFLAAGDPIYNRADRRWPSARSLWMESARSDGAELPRLSGSAAEAHGSAREWAGSGAAVVLTGREVTRSRLRDELRKGPSVAHLALHVVAPAESPDQSMIAVGLDDSGRQDFMTSGEIARSRFPAGLVVLSGCASGAGKPRAGIGLLGLTRSWLMSGSQAVLASLWPVGDDGEQFFRTFYRNYAALDGADPFRNAAAALRATQLEMLAGSWTGDPRYWAAYSVAGIH